MGKGIRNGRKKKKKPNPVYNEKKDNFFSPRLGNKEGGGGVLVLFPILVFPFALIFLMFTMYGAWKGPSGNGED